MYFFTYIFIFYVLVVWCASIYALRELQRRVRADTLKPISL